MGVRERVKVRVRVGNNVRWGRVRVRVNLVLHG